MTQEDINKRNEAIALFMGMYKTEYQGEIYFSDSEDLPCQFHISDLLYNYYWDWLMPVVEKISKMTYEDGDQIYPRTFAMSHENGSSYLFRLNRCELVESESFIESVFIGVSDFCLNQVK
jgi:hypothetical protein